MKPAKTSSPKNQPPKARSFVPARGRFAFWVVLAALLAVAQPGTAPAQSVHSLEQSIARERERAQAGRESVVKLTKKERALYSDLAEVEDDMDALQARIFEQELALSAIGRELEHARSDHRSLEQSRSEAVDGLDRLLSVLWPLRQARRLGATERGKVWEDSDRRFTWTAALYENTSRGLETVAARTREVKAAMARQEDLRVRAGQRLAEVNASKDDLLAKKLAFVSRIRDVRAERLSREQGLEQVLAAISDLNYRLSQITDRKFSMMKGLLPLPCDAGPMPGGGRNGSGGLGFVLADKAPVRAVFWGKVVHNDMLRGFGRVVIIYHGEDYYSLYAYLSESLARMGAEVEKGEPIGLAGFYPPAKGPGTYFELRLGQKAISSDKWFAAVNAPAVP